MHSCKLTARIVRPPGDTEILTDPALIFAVSNSAGDIGAAGLTEAESKLKGAFWAPAQTAMTAASNRALKVRMAYFKTFLRGKPGLPAMDNLFHWSDVRT